MSGVPERWVCPGCRSNNMPAAAACFQCRTPRPAPAVPPPTAPVPPQAEVVVIGSANGDARERRIDRWCRYAGVTAKRKEAWSRDGNSEIWLVVGPLLMAAGGLGSTLGLLRWLTGADSQPNLLSALVTIPLLPWGVALLAAYAHATWTRCIIFREVPLVDEASAPATGLTDVVISVVPNSNKTLKRGLYGVPCITGREPTGEFTFSQYLDTSTLVMGFRLVDGRGLWTFKLAPGKYRIASVGLQYWGKSVRPAMRVQVLDDDAGYDRAVLSCGSVAELRLLERCLRPHEAPR